MTSLSSSFLSKKNFFPIISLLLLAFLHSSSTSFSFAWSLFPQSKFEPPKHAPGVVVVDYAKHDELPPVRLGQRVIDLMSAMHFDALLQDTPDELRPPSIILFHGHKSSCAGAPSADEFRHAAETILPSRERLLIAEYDMDSAPVRGWFKFTPEMDLQKRFRVHACPTLVFVPRAKQCDGFTKWCEKKKLPDDPLTTIVGCDDFQDKCAPLVQAWDGKGNWVSWVEEKVKADGEPEISPIMSSYEGQKRWILERDDTTTDNEMRNYFLVESFPAFTHLGFLAMPIPPEMNDFLLGFWNRRKRSRVTEAWSYGQTQMSFHEAPTTFVSLDREGVERDRLANLIIKPIVEKWSGIAPLELTSFYGIREYGRNVLRGHIDRIDTHVLSVTFSLGKLNASDWNQLLTPEEASRYPSWPLEVIAFDGQVYRHDHPPGTMILYESSKLVHGRPYHNDGPPHLGAFCHFKPVSKDAATIEAWDTIARKARENQERNGKRGLYRSTNTVEPKKPVFSKAKYGDKTRFGGRDDNTEDNENDDEDESGRFAVRFYNDHTTTLDIHWVDTMHQGQLHLQGTLAPGTNLQIMSYLGHRFVWTQTNTKTPMPKGFFEIEAGSRNYRYGIRIGMDDDATSSTLRK